MKYVIADIECNGLDVDTVKVHCLVLRLHDQEPVSFVPEAVQAGVRMLQGMLDDGSLLVGHNVIEYDIPILRRYGLKIERHQVYDTLVVSRAAYPGSTLYDVDRQLIRKRPALEGQLKVGAHSLKAWGLRLGEHKGDYDGGWDDFNSDMLAYCVQDTATNGVLLQKLRDRIPDGAALLECRVAELCRLMRLHGVAFDRNAAVSLMLRLSKRREELNKILQDRFKPWYAPGELKVPKRTQQSRSVSPGEDGYTNVAKDCAYQAVVLTEFNPASTDHIADRLIKVYGWQPKDYTEGGKPQVTAEVLQDLPYPEAKLLAEYQEIKKILGYVSEGKGAWLKLEKDGRLHGKVNPTGTVSGRASHNSPNTGNVPTRSALGHECRSLFVASRGQVLVGADASGLQLRDLAHYLARWDDGAFARQCETGDVHEYMRQGTGLYTRAFQKTWTYAMLFGAGPPKLGQTAILDHRLALEKGLTAEPLPKQSQARSLGEKTLANLGNAVPAFPKLLKSLAHAADAGFLTTHDGRRVPIGSAHTAIAMLLQGGESVIMKTAMDLAADRIAELGGHYVLWVHDEFQVECPAEAADEIGKVLVMAIQRAGELLELRVRLDGEYKIGTNWAETH